MSKISIRFPLVRDEDIFDDREVRALWDDEHAKWWFSVLDIVAVLTDQSDYDKRGSIRIIRANPCASAVPFLKLTAPPGVADRPIGPA